MYQKQNMKSFAIAFAAAGHVLWAVFFLYVFVADDSGNDVIENMNKVGRIDLISLALTYLGIILVLFAFAGFWMLRGVVIEAARSEARSITDIELQRFQVQAQETFSSFKEALSKFEPSAVANDVPPVANISEVQNDE